MTHFKLLAAAALAASAVAISPSIAQDHGGHAMGGAPGNRAIAGAPSARTSSFATMRGGINMRAAQVNNAPAGAAPGRGGRWNGGNWNGGHVAVNNGNWNGSGGNWDRRRFDRGPGFGYGGGPSYYHDYAYNSYPYDNSYAYYNDPNYSDTFAFNTGPSVAVEVAPGGDDPAYCAQRYRSYDPASGTFLGYDGMRHPCP